jgi:arylsulfatase A-like enzyme
LALESVLIEDVALGGYLPAEAFGGVALIEVGPDARRGTCISTAAGARTSFEVKNAEQEFVFSYTIPSSVIRAGRAPELRVVLESGSTELATRVLDFVGDERTPPAWREERIELGRWLGREISANFELVSDEGDLRLAVVGEPQLVLRHSNPRTVLLITSDTHRADHLGFVAGAKGPRTEMLDKLAAGGVSFLDVTSSINNTTPSHVALFTGLTPRDTGIVANAKRLSDAAPTLAERFAEQGYATLAAVSAAPVCYQFSGLGQGFDRYSNPAYRSARNSKETLGQLLEWLPDYEGRPLFVWLHLYDAHAPYEPPQKFIDLYYKDVVDPYDPASPVADISLAPSWDTRIADPVYTESLYKGEVTYQDERLGELLAMDRFWNGTIAFTADHGENLRNGGEYRFEHRGLTHSTLAVPLIFRGPDLERGMRRRAPVQQIDVGRTLLDIAGYPEVDFPGENVFSKSEDDDTPRFAIEANGFSASILSGKWMLLFGLRPTRSNTDTTRKWLHNVALYDIEADEACQEDVSGQHPEVAAQLRRLMVRWLDQGQQNRWKEEAIGSAAEVARQLNELGYVTLDDDGSSGAWIEADCACENCARFE